MFEAEEARNMRTQAAPPDDIRTQAATYIDGEHRRVHDDLIHEHRRQEQRMLSWEKSRLESHARNREVAGLRYAQRLRTIEEKRDRIADRIQARHNSIGGRMQALTKKGRERQAAELQRLDDRAERLQAQAGRNYQALTERQFQAEQRDHIRTARELKDFRRDHEMRQKHIRDNQASREQKVEAQTQNIRRHTAEQTLRMEMQRVQE
jgi:uncharacterized protein YbjQ (UPF0145 family)